jgi:hypothetical protein
VKRSETFAMFDASALGKSLKETTVRTVKTDLQDIITVWCHSDQGVDLFYWKDERQNIIKQQMQFHGQIAEWNVIEGTRTGVVIEDEKDGKQISHVAYDESPVGLTVSQIVKILSEARDIKEPLRTVLIKNFAESRHFGLLSPQEVLSLYGQKQTWRNLAMAWWDRIIYSIRFSR